MWTRLLAALLLLLAATTPALAQDLRAVGQIRSSGPVTSEASRKIVSSLRGLVADFTAEGPLKENARQSGIAERFSSSTLKVDPVGRVHVYVSVTDTTEATLEALRRHDLEIEIVNDDFRIVQGWIPVDNLEALAEEDIVVQIRPPSYGSPRTGPVNSQGDAKHHCDQVRQLGFSGSGVKVGVVSDGVSGLLASQLAGELPTVQVLSPGSGDEGTAMLEIVHDCAPGAALAFSASGGSSLGFIQSVNALRAAGANIIVDDMGFYAEPYFADGAIAQNDRLIGNSVLRVSSAGNDRQVHYQGMFTPGAFDSQIPGIRHDFGGGDTLLRFRVGGASTATIVLQWANPFGAAADDYDLCVRLPNGALLACSAYVQNGNDIPIEGLSVTCPPPAGLPCSADLQITRFQGAARMLEVFCLGSCIFDQFNVVGDSIFGHPAVPEVLAVAAAPADNPSAIEEFSSAGGSTILFPQPEFRFKPDLTGVDCVTTSRPGFSPFCGTSAAAPHVAGVAALVMQVMGPSVTPAEMRQVLMATAVDLGPAEFDSDFGFGLVDALAAVQAVLPPPPSSTFEDVPPSHVFSVFIEALAEAGITGGCATNPPRYCPDAGVSRDQMAVFLLRGIHGAGYQPPPATGTMFTDVPLSHPFAKWIEQLAREGITAGCSTTPLMYCPGAGVTRGQMAVFLLRAQHGTGYQPPAATGTMFTDIPVTHVFAKWIEQLAREGITAGCSPTTYCPDGTVTRGQMAVFLVRTFNLPM